MDNFISLHNHSHFSILQAMSSPKDIFVRAKELNQSAIAITDTGSFAGIWDAWKASKETGIKLIAGAQFYFLSDVAKSDEKFRHIVLLAQNAIGYKNLLQLNRRGFDTPIIAGKKVLPVIDWKHLANFSNGITCLTGGGNGIIAQHINAKNFNDAEIDTKRLIEIFGIDNLGIEVQPNALNRPTTLYYNSINQIFTNYHLIKLAEKFNLRVVPTTNSLYLHKEDANIHDVLLAIGAMQPVYSNARLKYNVPDFYMKSGEEIKVFFARNFGEEFANEICNNTIYFADKSENPIWIDPTYSNAGSKELPVFDVKNVNDYDSFQEWLSKQSDKIKKISEDAAYLRFRCYQAFNKMQYYISILKRQEYIESH